MMLPTQLKTKKVVSCRSCSNKRQVKQNDKFKVKESVKTSPKDEVMIFEENQELTALPKTNTRCPKCDNDEAYWWVAQTRSADEAPTRFFACVSCEHKWREYD